MYQKKKKKKLLRNKSARKLSSHFWEREWERGKKATAPHTDMIHMTERDLISSHYLLVSTWMPTICVYTHYIFSSIDFSLIKKIYYFFCSLSEKFFCDIFTASASSHLWEKKYIFVNRKKIYRTLRRGRNTRGKKFVMWRIK